MEYTKGKWTACAFGVRVNDMEIADCVLGNVRQPGMTITEAQANAERIVETVNCHDDLVEALKATERGSGHKCMRESCRLYAGEPSVRCSVEGFLPGCDYELKAQWKAIDKALAKAENK